MRCLALAGELRRRGAQVTFLCRPLPGNLIDLIGREGHACQSLPECETWSESADAEACRALLPEAVDWLVVDHYELGRAWEQVMRDRAEHILAIDDLADRAHDCDILLDQNLHPAAENRYAGLIGADCRLLLGPRYALLRPDFAELRRRGEETDERVRRLLVFFGGGDAGNETGRLLAALALLDLTGIEVDVVVGGANPHYPMLLEQCRRIGDKVHLHRQVDNMAELMAAADLAVGAGGTATWERLAMGLPSLAWAVADNQRPGLAVLAAEGALASPSPDSLATIEGIAHHLYALMHNPTWRRSLARRGSQLCDGKGVQRVAAAMLGGALRLRRSVETDCRMLHEWRNHPEVRRYALDPSPIPYSQHEQWFQAALRQEERILLVAEDAGGQPVGVLRYDLAGDQAEVSVYLSPERMGLGYGEAILRAGERWLGRAHPEITRFRATIRPENVASRTVFGRLGYGEAYGIYTKDMKR
jgi:UDP-2,4-diacetamido-2,4,6-trideoxy-beta-L-altropyranose hydrolase